MVRQIFKKSGILFAGMFTSKVLTTLVFIGIARVLLPSDFGVLSLFITISTLATVIGDFGLTQWYQKNISLLNEEQGLHKLISARLIGIVGSLFLLFPLLMLTNSFSAQLVGLLVLLLLPEALLSVSDAYYLLRQNVLPIAMKSGSKIIFLCVGLFLFGPRTTLHFSAFLLVLGSYFTALWFVPWRKIVKRYHFSFLDGISTFQASKSFALLTLTSLVYARGDALIVQTKLGSQALGLYSSAYRYLESLAMLPSALTQNLFSHAAKKNGIPLVSLMKICGVMSLGGGIVGAATYVAAPVLIEIILGPEYVAAVPVLRAFSVTVFLFFCNSPLSTVVQGSSYVHRFLPFGIANTCLNLVLNFVLVPIYGIIGAAVAMIASEFIGLFINIFFTWKIYSQKK